MARHTTSDTDGGRLTRKMRTLLAEARAYLSPRKLRQALAQAVRPAWGWAYAFSPSFVGLGWRWWHARGIKTVRRSVPAMRTLETLEPRVLLSGNFLYVNTDWNLVADKNANGVMDQGDTVSNLFEDNSLQSLTFGVDAFADITTAIAAAKAGQQIVMVSGSYGSAYSATVDKSVTVEGWKYFAANDAAGDADVTQGNLNPNLTTVFNGASLTITGSGVTVEGIGFNGAPSTGAVRVNGTGASATVLDNAFNTGSVGVRIDTGSATLESSNTFGGITTGVLINAGGTATDISSTFTNTPTAVDVEGGTATVSGATITGGTTGVKVGSGSLFIDATDGAVDITNAATAVQVAGGTASVSGAAISGATTGIDVTGGTLTVGAGDSITGGTTGLLVSGSTASISGDSLNNLSFSGQSGNYITLASGALNSGTPVSLDATGAKFGGVVGDTLTSTGTPTAYSIENKIGDYLDSASVGYVELNAANVFVSQLSETTTPGAIQRGVNVVTPGDTVNVQAGTFTGGVQITKAVKLLGANATANPTNGGGRGGESTIEPGVSGANPHAGPHTFLIEVLASNVTIEGFTLTGQNDSLGTAANQNAAELTGTTTYAQAAEGIAAFDPTGIADITASSSAPGTTTPGSVTIENNIIEDLSYQGVDMGWGTNGNPATGGNVISDNLIQNIGAYNDEGDAVRLYNNFYADVTGDQILNTRMGVEAGNFWLAAPTSATPIGIENNEIQVRRRGVFYNNFFGSPTAMPVSGNTITATADGLSAGNSLWTGVYIISQTAGTDTANFFDNSIDGSGSSYTLTAGYTLLNTWATNGVTIGGDTSADNSITNVTYGIWETTGDPNGFGGGATAAMGVTISGVNMSASQIGVYVEEDSSNSNTVSATINGDTSITTNTTSGTGIEVSGATASATISGNNIYDNTTGIDFTAGGGGSVTGNDFTGTTVNGTDLNVDSTAGMVADGGGNKFAGTQTINDLEQGNTLNATADFFGAVLGSDLTPAQAWAAEGKISDYLDNPGDGYVELNANEVFVAQSSETPANPDAIQRGVNVAGMNDTVDVQAGNYVGDVSIDSSLTLDGGGVANVTAPASVSNAAIISVSAPNVTVEGFNITVNQPDAGAGIAAVSGASGANLFDGLKILNNVITTTGSGGGLFNVLDGTTYSAGIAVLANANSAAPTVTISGNTVSAHIDAVTPTNDSFIKRGIWLFQVQGTIGGDMVTDGNTLQGSYEDLQDSFARGALLIENNAFDGVGVTITEPNGDAPTTVMHNTFDSAFGHVDDASLLVKHDYNGTSSPVTISDNTFTVSPNSIGVLSADSSGVSVTGNTFAPAAGATGTVDIDVDTMVPSSSQATPLVANSISVTGNTFNAAANSDATAIQIANDNANASFGAITIGGSGAAANTFSENLADFIVEAPPSDSVSFSGDNYATTKKGNVAVDIDASDNVFGVSSGDTLANHNFTLADYYEVEGKVLDGVDYSGAGLVSLTPGTVYVAQSSEISNAGSLQRAVDLAASNGDGAIDVQAGAQTYAGGVTISNPVTILGDSQSGVTVVPATDDGKGQTAFLIASSDVAIENLTIDGQSNTMSSDQFADGVITQYSAVGGIYLGINTETYNHLTAENLTVEDVSSKGIDFKNQGSNDSILDNTLTNAGSQAVTIIGGSGVITGNIISDNTGQGIGIASNALYDTSGHTYAANLTIQGNQITGENAGLYLSGLGDGSMIGGTLDADANTIDVTNAGSGAVGILISYAQGTTTIQKNQITAAGDADGILLFYDTIGSVQVLDNTIEVPSPDVSAADGSGNAAGIYITDNGESVGEPTSSGSFATILGNTVEGFVTGIDVESVNNGADQVTATIGDSTAGDSNTIDGMSVTGSTGILVTGTGASATITDNNTTIKNNTVGIDVENGATATIDGNKFSGNSTDVKVGATGSVASLTDNTFTATSLYIDNEAAADLNAATGNTFADVTPSAGILAADYAIEGKIVDGIDQSGSGLVTIVDGYLYVADSSEAAPQGSAGSIQRAVDLASAGDIVNVQAGTFTGQVSITKDLTLLGAGEALTVIQAAAILSTEDADTFDYEGSTKQSVVTINGVAASMDSPAGVTIENLTVDGANEGDTVVSGNDFVGIGIHNSDATIDNVAVTNVADTTIDGDQSGRAIFVGNDDSVARNVTIENSTITGYQKNGIDVRGDGLAATITGNIITGAGEAGVNGQNGIVVGFGAVGTVTGNTISGNLYGGTDPDSYAAGVLLYDAGAGTTVENNASITGNDVGVEVESDTAEVAYTISGNTITNSAIAGVYLMTDVGGTTVTGNTLMNNTSGLGVDSTASNLGAITGNTFTGGTLYIDNQSAQTIDARTDTFDVGPLDMNNNPTQVAGSALTLPEAFAVEDKITDAIDQSGLGFVQLQTGEVFVAHSSETATNPDAVQRGIDAASSGDTVNVQAGSYVGQVAITTDLTLSGAGKGSTILQAPASLATTGDDVFTYSGSTKQSVLTIQPDASHPAVPVAVTVLGLTVDGANEGDAVVSGNDFVGIGIYDSDATIDGVAVTNVADATIDGDQSGRAIFVGNDTAAHSVTIENSTISGYQKNGIDVRGTGLTATITGNIITGANELGVTAQNGIVLGFGATGTISGNTISGDKWNTTDPQAAAILLDQAVGPVTVTDNTLTNSDYGIAVFDSSAVIGNTTTVEGVTTTHGNTITGDTIGLDVDQDIPATPSKAVAQYNTITGDGEGVVIADGALADLGHDAGDLTPGHSNFTGLGASAGHNNLTGYRDVAAHYAIDDQNTVSGTQPDVLAEDNDFGPYPLSDPAIVGEVIHDHADNAANTTVYYMPALDGQTAPTTVYVNAAWAGTTFGVDADGADGGAMGNGIAFGFDEFSNIQDAVNALASGHVSDTVNIYDGTYAEDVTVNKVTDALYIQGQDEALTKIDPVAGGGTGQTAFLIESNNVSLYNLTIDGKTNTASTDTFGTGVTTNYVPATDNFLSVAATAYSDLVVQQTTVENVSGDAIAVLNQGTGDQILQDTITNAGGWGIHIHGASGDIEQNMISDTADAIGVNALYDYANNSAASAPVLDILGNTITGANVGLDLAALGAGSRIGGDVSVHPADANNVTVSGSGAAGIIIEYAKGGVTVEGNSVTVGSGGDGILLFADGAIAVGLSGNTVTGASGNAGILVTDDNSLAALGEAAPLPTTNIAITSNTISGFGTGIEVQSQGGQLISANIGDSTAGDANIITGTTTSTGILVTGADASATISGNSSTDAHGNPIGIDDNSIGISVTDGAAASISGNYLGGNATGIQITSSSTTATTISDNTIDGSSVIGGSVGIDIDGGVAVAITGGNITAETAGIEIEVGSATLSDTVTVNSPVGVLLDGDGVSVSGSGILTGNGTGIGVKITGDSDTVTDIEIESWNWGISNSGTGTTEITDVTITGNAAGGVQIVSGDATMTGGSITAAAATTGVEVESGGNATLSGVTITGADGTTLDETNTLGSTGVKIDVGGTATIEGGTTISGGGIGIESSGTLTLATTDAGSAAITGMTSGGDSKGYGIDIEAGTASITDAILGGTAADDGNVVGLYVAAAGSAMVFGGAFTDNTTGIDNEGSATIEDDGVTSATITGGATGIHSSGSLLALRKAGGTQQIAVQITDATSTGIDIEAGTASISNTTIDNTALQTDVGGVVTNNGTGIHVNDESASVTIDGHNSFINTQDGIVVTKEIDSTSPLVVAIGDTTNGGNTFSGNTAAIDVEGNGAATLTDNIITGGAGDVGITDNSTGQVTSIDDSISGNSVTDELTAAVTIHRTGSMDMSADELADAITGIDDSGQVTMTGGSISDTATGIKVEAGASAAIDGTVTFSGTATGVSLNGEASAGNAATLTGTSSTVLGTLSGGAHGVTGTGVQINGANNTISDIDVESWNLGASNSATGTQLTDDAFAGNATGGVDVVTGDVTMTGGSISNTTTGIDVAAGASATIDGTVTFTDTTTGVSLNDNATLAGTNTAILFDDSTGTGTGIQSSGTADSDRKIADSIEIDSWDWGISMPDSTGTLALTGVTLSHNTVGIQLGANDSATLDSTSSISVSSNDVGVMLTDSASISGGTISGAAGSSNTVGIEDTKNVADGAAKGQASEPTFEGLTVGVKVVGNMVLTGNIFDNNATAIQVESTGNATIGDSTSGDGNTIYNNTTGIEIESDGQATITDNDFSNAGNGPVNGTDLKLDLGAGTVAVTGNAFAGTQFINNQSAENIDATTDTFNVGTSPIQVGGNALTLPEAYSIENRITDAIDQTGLGFVRIQNGAVFVAQSSETADADAIQRGVDAANTDETTVPANGDIVNVQAGTYIGGAVIDKSLTIAGPNAGTAGYDTRVAEVIVEPGADSTITSNMFLIEASGVTIEGMTLNGSNSPFGPGALLANGTYAQSGYGISNATDIDANDNPATAYLVSNTNISDNIIENFAQSAITGNNGTLGATSNNTIQDNLIQNISANTDTAFGYAVLLHNNYYATITGNHILTSQNGIQVENFFLADPSAGPAVDLVSGNVIDYLHRGIFLNLQYESASPWTFSDNNITGNNVATDAADGTKGISIESVQGAVSETFTDNNINGSTDGYELWNLPTTGTVTVSGGTISNTTYGIWATNNAEYGLASASSATISGVAITGATTAGIYVQGDSGAGTSAVNLTVNGDTAISGSPTGILVSGPNASATISGATIDPAAPTGTGVLVAGGASATLTGNTIDGLAVGVEVTGAGSTATIGESGAGNGNDIYHNTTGIEFTDGGSTGTGSVADNDFDNAANGPVNGTDLLLTATSGAVTVGNGNTFTAAVSIEDQNAAQGINLSATTGNTFNGTALVTGATPSPLSNLYAIEDTIVDAIDVSGYGLVRLEAGNVYVTPNSFVGTDIASIQRGVDAATAGDTVNVEAGTYLGQVTINKALTLLGANAGIAGSGTRGAESTIDGNSATENYYVVQIQSSGVTIDGFEIENPLYSGTSDASGILVEDPSGGEAQLSDVTIQNNRIHDIGTLNRPHAYDGTYGINVAPVNGLTIQDNAIYNLSNSGNAGIEAVGILTWGNDADNTAANLTLTADNLHILDNTFSAITDPSGQAYAIRLAYDSANATVSGNSITGIAFGIATSPSMAAGTAVAINDNTITGASTTGLLLRSTYGETIYQNTVTDGGAGMEVASDAVLTSASENYFTGNATGILIDSGAGTVGGINDNSITGNTIGLENDSTATVDATENWWGNANGPTTSLNTYAVTGPTGDSVVGSDVSIVKWLTDGTDTNSASNLPDVPGFQPNVNNNVPTVNSAEALANNDHEGSAQSVTATVTTTTDPVTYYWSVTKNGGAFGTPAVVGQTASLTNTYSFTPDDNGTYVVTVTAVDQDGASDTTSTTLTITNVVPTAALTAVNDPQLEGSAEQFTASATDPGSLDTTAGYTYNWTVSKQHGSDPVIADYASGISGPGAATASINFTPDDDGTYIITVTATDKDGGTSVAATDTLHVANIAPTASLSNATGPLLEGSEEDLTASATDPSTADTAAGFTYNWTISKQHGSDPAVANWATGASGPAPTAAIAFTPDDDGTYVVTVTATDKDTGVSDAVTETLVIANVNPTAAITGTPVSPVNEGSAIALGSNVTDPSTADTTAGFSYLWTVNKDGDAYAVTANTAASFTFTPDDNGNYVVTLTATDKDGGSDTVSTSTISVLNVAPSNLVLTVGTPINENDSASLSGSFSDPGSADTHTVSINWGDGSAVQVLPTLGAGVLNFSGITHQYLQNNVGNAPYTISVTVTDKDNAATSNTTPIVVDDVAPTIDLSASATVTNEGSVYTLKMGAITDPGTLDVVTGYSINWGDGNTSNFIDGGSPANTTQTHTYEDGQPTTENISVTLIETDPQVSDAHGAAGTITVTVNNVNPTATFANFGTISEGSSNTVFFSGASDPSPVDTAAGLHYAYDLNDDGQFNDGAGDGTYTGSAGEPSTLNVPASFFSTPGPHTIVGRIIDKDGGYTDYTTTFDVDNVAPSVHLVSPANASTGSVFATSGSWSDAGNDGPYSATVNYGDGSGVQTLTLTAAQQSSHTFNLSHTYTTANSYTITVTVTDSTGYATPAQFAPMTGTGSMTVNVANTTLRVTSVTATGNGFDIAFNRAIDISDIALYGSGNVVSPISVQLQTIGGGSTTINGSLVWDAGTNIAHWIQTRGNLVNGSYMVTLASGTSGDDFHDNSANALDGNNDGTAGDNYSSTIVVNNPVVLSIPNFARGPGQAVITNAEGTQAGATGLPVTISDGTGVESVHFVLDYDPNVLSISTIPADLQTPGSNWAVTVNPSAPGVLDIVVFSTNGSTLGSGPQTVLTFKNVSVLTTATYGASSLLSFNTVLLNEALTSPIPVIAAETECKIVDLGDTNDAGQVNGADALNISRVVVHLDTGFDKDPLTDPVLIGDLTGDGTLSGLDAADASLMFVNPSTQPQVPTPDGMGTGGVAGHDPEVESGLGSSQTITAGADSTAQASIQIEDDANGLASADLIITYNPSLLTLTDGGVALSNALSTLGWAMTEGIQTPGTLKVTIWSAETGQPITTSGALDLIDLTFQTGSTPGVSTLGIPGQDLNGVDNTLSMTTDPGSITVAAPSVVGGVSVSGSAWTPAFLSYLATTGQGSSLGYAVTSANNTTDLPWVNLNTLSIQFSENVTITNGQTALAVYGVNNPSYTAASFSYNSMTHVATWTYAQPFTADKLLLDLNSADVTDAAGNPLAGGASNGDFQFRLNVVPGDVNNDTGVNIVDTNATRNLQSTVAGSPNYRIFNDVDGNGGINIADTNAVRNEQTTVLPSGTPQVPVNPVVDSVFLGSLVVPAEGAASGVLLPDPVPADNPADANTSIAISTTDTISETAAPSVPVDSAPVPGSETIAASAPVPAAASEAATEAGDNTVPIVETSAIAVTPVDPAPAAVAPALISATIDVDPQAVATPAVSASEAAPEVRDNAVANVETPAIAVAPLDSAPADAAQDVVVATVDADPQAVAIPAASAPEAVDPVAVPVVPASTVLALAQAVEVPAPPAAPVVLPASVNTESPHATMGSLARQAAAAALNHAVANAVDTRWAVAPAIIAEDAAPVQTSSLSAGTVLGVTPNHSADAHTPPHPVSGALYAASKSDPVVISGGDWITPHPTPPPGH